MFWAMQDEVLRLFHEVGDLSPVERKLYFEQHQVPLDLQRELESLLQFDSHDAPLADLVSGEAQAFLDELIADATRPEFTYQHQWRLGDVLMWDNRAMMHRGRPWPHDQPRGRRPHVRGHRSLAG